MRKARCDDAGQENAAVRIRREFQHAILFVQCIQDRVNLFRLFAGRHRFAELNLDDGIDAVIEKNAERKALPRDRETAAEYMPAGRPIFDRKAGNLIVIHKLAEFFEFLVCDINRNFLLCLFFFFCCHFQYSFLTR